MIYNVVLFHVWTTWLCIYILFFIFFSIMVYYELLNIWIFAPKLLFTYLFFGTWYLNSLARNWTCTPAVEAWSINWWATREAPTEGFWRPMQYFIVWLQVSPWSGPSFHCPTIFLSPLQALFFIQVSFLPPICSPFLRGCPCPELPFILFPFILCAWFSLILLLPQVLSLPWRSSASYLLCEHSFLPSPLWPSLISPSGNFTVRTVQSYGNNVFCPFYLY